MNNKSLLVVALLVSLAVNLLIAGVVIGRKGAPPPEPPPMAWAAQRMDAATQRLVRQRMRERLPVVRPLREAMRRANMRLQRVLGAEELDPQALADALKQLRDASVAYQAEIHANLVNLAAELPREQRTALVAAALSRERGMRPAAGPRGNPGEGGAASGPRDRPRG